MPADDTNETLFLTKSEFSDQLSEYVENAEPDDVLFKYRTSKSLSLEVAHIHMMACSRIFLEDSDESRNLDAAESYATWLFQNDTVTSNSMQTDQSSYFHASNRVFESSFRGVSKHGYQTLKQHLQNEGKSCTLGVCLHLKSDLSSNNEPPKQVFSFEILFTCQGGTGEENDVFENLVVSSFALEHMGTFDTINPQTMARNLLQVSRSVDGGVDRAEIAHSELLEDDEEKKTFRRGLFSTALKESRYVGIRELLFEPMCECISGCRRMCEEQMQESQCGKS